MGMYSRISTILFPVGFVAMLPGTAAMASPITYTLTATASGILGGTVFTDAPITVTSIADTSQVFLATPLDNLNPGFGGTTDYEVIAMSSTIDIAGFAPATFSDQTFWEDPN